jgi:hypothetical protein
VKRWDTRVFIIQGFNLGTLRGNAEYMLKEKIKQPD